MQWFERRTVPLVVAALAVAACSDSNSPETNFDPVSLDSRAETFFKTVSDNQAVQSLGVLGDFFVLTPNRAALTPPVDLAPEGVVRWMRRAQTVLGDAQPSLSAGSALAVLPSNALGSTFVFNENTGSYEVDASRTGAPQNGVRFILYAVDPILGQPLSPVAENEIGHVDLTDLSSSSENTIRIVAVVNQITMVDYTASGSISTIGDPTVTFVANGFVSDGSSRVDFDIDFSLTSTRLNLDYELSSQSDDFSVTLIVDGTSTTTDLDITIRDGTDTVVIEATQLASGATSGSISANGTVVIQFEGTEEDVSFTDASGDTLSTAEIAALQGLVDFVDGLLESFDQLTQPACLVFVVCT